MVNHDKSVKRSGGEEWQQPELGSPHPDGVIDPSDSSSDTHNDPNTTFNSQTATVYSDSSFPRKEMQKSETKATSRMHNFV